MKELSPIEYRERIVNVLFKIDEICRDNGIQYYLWAGTLLGAVRHGGLIPWDDDVDIAMKRADYDQLASVMKRSDCGLTFIRPEDNPDTIYSYGKVCDKSTIVKEASFRGVRGYGAFVDVFPFDYLPDDEIVRTRLHRKYLALQKLITHASRTTMPEGSGKKRIAYIISRPFKATALVQKVNARYVSLNEQATGRLGLAWDYSYPAEWLEGSSEVPFEGRMLMTFRDPDAVLRNDYGDYMTLPPESERKPSHGLKCYAKYEMQRSDSNEEENSIGSHYEG